MQKIYCERNFDSCLLVITHLYSSLIVIAHVWTCLWVRLASLSEFMLSDKKYIRTLLDICTYRFTHKGSYFNENCRSFIQYCFKKICGFRQFPRCFKFSILFLHFLHLMKNVTHLNSLDFRRFRSSLKLHPLWVTLYINIEMKT